MMHYFSTCYTYYQYYYQDAIVNECRLSFQDFGNMTHDTHGMGNFSDVMLKIGKKMHELNF
jgi:hypothetical protein